MIVVGSVYAPPIENFVDALGRRFGDLSRRHIYSGGLRGIGAILRCCDETATISQITDDFSVVRRVDDGSCLGSESSDVLRASEIYDFEISRQKSFYCDGVDEFASEDQFAAYPALGFR